MTIQIEETNQNEFLSVLDQGITQSTQNVIGAARVPLNFILSDNGITIGGMKARYVGQHFFVSWLYVDSKFQKQGWGRKIMLAGENRAKQIGCKKVFVDTMVFQAPDFYVGLGYKECARIKDFYEGYDRIFFVKDL